jgi:LacI family transcriptional regulator
MNETIRQPSSALGNPAGIKEIAQALGVSIGTVDRALHGRSGISPKTRERVLKMVQTLGYKPNIAARHLKLNRKVRISVQLPEEIAAFFDALRSGIREAASPFHSTVELQFRTYPHLCQGDVALFEEALREQVDGIIIAPGNPRLLRPCLRRAAAKGIPVVCVATDAPEAERLTSISTDPYTSGAMTAEILTRCVKKPGAVLVVTGGLSTVDHTEKLRGFAAWLSEMRSPLTILPVIEAHDDPAEAGSKTREALQRHRDLCAVYITTANSLPVLVAMEEAALLPQIATITTDLFPALVPYIRRGAILGTIYQRPQTQGRMALLSIYRFLMEGVSPLPRQPLPPHIILQSNLDLFLEILQSDLERTEEFLPQSRPEYKQAPRPVHNKRK